jgi:hypothetical protein
MRQQKSKLICKCKTKGGVLAQRKAGNSKTKNALYVQHYDPTKKAGKRPCYISEQNIALIRLNDRRYLREYKSLVNQYYDILADNSSPKDKMMLDLIAEDAYRLLCDMGWPHKVVDPYRKFLADITEIMILNSVRDHNKVGIKITRERAIKKLRVTKPRFKLKEEDKEWWGKIAESGRKLLSNSD